MTYREKSLERYRWLREHGICTGCGQADAEAGRAKCAACLEKHRTTCRKWRAANRERKRAYDRQWVREHPDYYRQWRAAHPVTGAGRLADRKPPKLAKPSGTCRRKGCWESAIEFGCWCPAHLEEMRERRRLRDYLKKSGSTSSARSSPPNGW